MKNRVTQHDKGSFETGQLPNSLPDFKTALKSKFGKSGIFETGASDLAGAGFETGVAEQALKIPRRHTCNIALITTAPCDFFDGKAGEAHCRFHCTFTMPSFVIVAYLAVLFHDNSQLLNTLKCPCSARVQH